MFFTPIWTRESDMDNFSVDKAALITELDKFPERAGRPRTLKGSWKWLLDRPRVLVGGVIIVGVVVVALLAPLIAPYNPTAPIFLPTQSPSAGDLLCTDELGRDTLSRVIYGSRISLLVGLVAVAIAFLAG